MVQRARTLSIGACREAGYQDAWWRPDFGGLPYCILRRGKVSSVYRINPAKSSPQPFGGLFASTVINPLQLAH